MSQEEITGWGGGGGYCFTLGSRCPIESGTRSFPSPAPLLSVDSETFKSTLSPCLLSKATTCPKFHLKEKRNLLTPISPFYYCCVLSFPAASLSHPFSKFSRTLEYLGYYLCCYWSGNRKRNHTSHLSYLGKFYSMQIKMVHIQKKKRQEMLYRQLF